MDAEEFASKAESVSETEFVSGSRWRTDWRGPSAVVLGSWASRLDCVRAAVVVVCGGCDDGVCVVAEVEAGAVCCGPPPPSLEDAGTAADIFRDEDPEIVHSR